jgi:chromosome segregation ATPase
MSTAPSPSTDPEALASEIESLQVQLEEARNEADRNLQQLRQLQDELEFYFLAHQELHQLLEQHQQEERRAEVLIAALLERIEATGS